MSLIDAWDIDTSFSLPNDEPDLGHLTGASMAGSRAQRFSFEDSALDMESTDTNVLTVTEEKRMVTTCNELAHTNIVLPQLCSLWTVRFGVDKGPG